MSSRGILVQSKAIKWSLLLIPILILIGVANGSAAPPSPDQVILNTVTLPPEAFLVAEASLPFTQSTGSKTEGLDSAIQKLILSTPSKTQALAESMGLRLSGDRVHVQIDIQASAIESIRQAITDVGGEVTKVRSDRTLLQGWLPIDNLLDLSARQDIYLIRRPEQAILLDKSLSAGSTSEGLAAINAPAWHTAGHRGAGIKVGIIDSGFQGYPTLLGTDLPASVTVRNFVDGETDWQVDGTTKHGASCAEIVYDTAPEASLYLAKISTSLDMQEAVFWLINAQVDVISTSLGWYNVTPGDGTGQFADLVQTARNAGILWATAAGNDREYHWGGAFNDTNGNGLHEFNGKEINCFGPGGDQCYQINPNFLFQVYLRWDDWTTVNQDYDLYLFRYDGGQWYLIGSSTNVQNGGPGQQPTESAFAVTSGSATFYGFRIQRINSTRDVNLEVIAPKLARLNEIVHARSLANLADAPAAMTVAALDVTAPYPQEAYSSEGPTNGLGGTAAGGAIKPDLAAYTNVSTQGHGIRGFNGTSAATPHVAGAAALVLSANPGFTPDETRSFLQERAIDMGVSGRDSVYGYGRLYLGTPISSIIPQIGGILPSQGANNGVVQITNLFGDYFEGGAAVTLTRSGHPDITATQVVVVSNHQITCEFDLTGAATGAWDVVVTNPGGHKGTLPQGFTIVDPSPIVSSILPSAGEYTGWQHDLSLVGNYYQPGATVKLRKSNHPDIQGANVRWINAGTLLCDLDLRGAANGPWDVVVTNPDGQSGTRIQGYTINAPATAPRIYNVIPDQGQDTESIPLFTVIGSQFAMGASPPTVKLTQLGRPDIIASNVLTVDSETITCHLDLNGVSAGPWNVTVINPNGEYWTLTNGFAMIGHVFMPQVARVCPPPVLEPIDNVDGDSIYWIEWSLEPCGTGLLAWELQHDDTPNFDNPTIVPIPDPSQTSYEANTPTPGTHHWRVRAYRSDQSWSDWSNVQSVTVVSRFANIWVENYTGGTLTLEIVGVESKSFAPGRHYWRTVLPGTYTVKAWGCGAPYPSEGYFYFGRGDNTLAYECPSVTTPQSIAAPPRSRVSPR